MTDTAKPTDIDAAAAAEASTAAGIADETAAYLTADETQPQGGPTDTPDRPDAKDEAEAHPS